MICSAEQQKGMIISCFGQRWDNPQNRNSFTGGGQSHISPLICVCRFVFFVFSPLEGVLHLLRSVSQLEAWGFTWTLKRLCKQSNPPGWHISVCHCQVCSPTPYRFKGTEKIPRELGRSNVSAPLWMEEQDEHSKMTFGWALQRMSEQTNWLHEGRLRAQNPLMGLLFTAWDLP